MQSLRDKLLKAGLVTEDQALKAESKIVVKRAPPPSPSELEGKRRSSAEGGRGRPPGRGGEGRGRPPGGRRERAPSASIPKLPPMPGSRAYQQAESRRQLQEAKAQRELVQAAQVEIDVGATVFYFMTRKNRLRRLELTEAQAKELEAGRLAVVERPDPDRIEHALVPAATADELLEKFPKAVRFYNRPDQPVGFMTDEEIERRSAQQAERDAAKEAAAAEEAAKAASKSGEASAPKPDGGTDDASGGDGAPLKTAEGGDVPELPDPDAGQSAPAPEPAPSEGGDVPEKPDPDTADSD